jgi:hypothetical protein
MFWAPPLPATPRKILSAGGGGGNAGRVSVSETYEGYGYHDWVARAVGMNKQGTLTKSKSKEKKLVVVVEIVCVCVC